MHPDIFIVDPRPLVHSLNVEVDVIAARRVTVLHHRVCPGLVFNFFAFRPHRIDRNAFKGWSNWTATPEIYLYEVAFAEQIRARRVALVNHVSQKRFSCRGGTRCFVDPFGLWHMHNESLVSEFVHTRLPRLLPA